MKKMKIILMCLLSLSGIMQAAEIKLKNNLSVPIDVEVHYGGKWHPYHLNPGQTSKKIQSWFHTIDQVRWSVPEYKAKKIIGSSGEYGYIPVVSHEETVTVPAACYQTNKKKFKIKLHALNGKFQVGSGNRFGIKPPYLPRAGLYCFDSSIDERCWGEDFKPAEQISCETFENNK